MYMYKMERKSSTLVLLLLLTFSNLLEESESAVIANLENSDEIDSSLSSLDSTSKSAKAQQQQVQDTPSLIYNEIEQVPSSSAYDDYYKSPQPSFKSVHFLNGPLPLPLYKSSLRQQQQQHPDPTFFFNNILPYHFLGTTMGKALRNNEHEIDSDNENFGEIYGSPAVAVAEHEQLNNKILLPRRPTYGLLARYSLSSGGNDNELMMDGLGHRPSSSSSSSISQFIPVALSPLSFNAKRSPSCMRKCIQQGFLHPAQCHSMC